MPLDPPALEYAFTAHLRVDARSMVQTAHPPRGGARWALGIAGGWCEGPLLSGDLLPLGIEAPWLRPDGSLMIDARWFIRTEDGATVYVRNRGIRRPLGPEVMAAWQTRDGETSATDFYFRVQPTFEAPTDSAHAWLNDHLFVGVLDDSPPEPAGVGPSIHYYVIH